MSNASVVQVRRRLPIEVVSKNERMPWMGFLVSGTYLCGAVSTSKMPRSPTPPPPAAPPPQVVFP